MKTFVEIDNENNGDYLNLLSVVSKLSDTMVKSK